MRRTDPRYDERKGRSAYIPPPDHEVHDGYYSDYETHETRKTRVRERSISHKQVPSPPRVPEVKYSEQPLPRTRERQSGYHRVPSPPPRLNPRRENHGKGVRHSSLDSRYEYQQNPLQQTPLVSRGLSFDSRKIPLPRTPPSPYPRINTAFLSPEDGAEYSTPRGDRPQELKRWKSERLPGHVFTEATATESTEQPWPTNKYAASVAFSDSTFKSSLPSSAGFIGDRAYQYETLQGAGFRLVRIFPEKKTIIRCEIIHASLESPPPYVAISYAWGDPGKTRRIELGGSQLPIAVSLYGALEALRQKVQSVLVWADALCIDQQNKEEKTQQVRLMTSIYQTAESVAIWLGPEEDDSALAIKITPHRGR